MFVFAIRKNSSPIPPPTPPSPPPTPSKPNTTNILSTAERQDQNESAAILKIKESMQEEAKRFEKDSDPPDYFMQ